MKQLGFRQSLFIGTALAVGLTAGVASAQEAAPPSPGGQATALEEVVVTARKREENLQTTPVAITAVTAQALEARNVVTLEKISQIAPSLTIYQTTGGIGSAGTFMRGIGYAENLLGQDSPIGFYVDGVAFGRVSTAVMQLVEPERVEVLRGPQGTLFGRNTTAGAILITTHAPSDEFGGMVKASYGRFGAKSFQGRIDTGLLGSSGVKTTFAYQHREQDGTRNALNRPRDLDPGANKSDAYFFKAVGEWDKLTAQLSADYNVLTGVPATSQIVDATAAERGFLAQSQALGGSAGYVITRTPLRDIPSDSYGGVQRVWNQGVGLTLTYEVAPYLTLKSISSVRAFKRHDPSAYGPADNRANLGTAAAPRIVSFNGFYSLVDRWQRARQKSEELQALGTVGDFDYVAGFYYFKENGWDAGLTRLPFVLASGAVIDSVTPRLYTVQSKSVAGFGQVNYRPSFLDKKLELTGGVRWTKDTRDFNQTLALVRTASLETKNWSYLLSANYQWTPGVMTYAKYSTGYRAGGFNARSVPPTSPIFSPEKLKSAEGGFKIDAFDRRLRFNAAAYYNKYRNLQVAQFQPPGATSSGGSAAINANATYKGFELELEAVPVEGLTLSASYGYVDPKYKNFPRALEAGIGVVPGCTPINNAAGTAVGQDCAAIAKFTTFPKTTAGLGASYVFPATSYGEWSIRADYAYRGRTEWGTFNLPSTPFQNSVVGKSYGLLSARIALSEIPLNGGSAKAQIAVYGENLTDKDYVVQGIDYGFMGTIVYGDPRTFGIEGKVTF